MVINIWSTHNKCHQCKGARIREKSLNHKKRKKNQGKHWFFSFCLEFNGIIFGIAFDSFCSIFVFFSMRFISLLYCYFTSYHSKLKRLLLERPVSQISVLKNRLELSFLVHILQLFLSKKPKISWTIFDNSVHC